MSPDGLFIFIVSLLTAILLGSLIVSKISFDRRHPGNNSTKREKLIFQMDLMMEMINGGGCPMHLENEFSAIHERLTRESDPQQVIGKVPFTVAKMRDDEVDEYLKKIVVFNKYLANALNPDSGVSL
jgi:hypothetical protein